jgi:hypothetical protein
VDWKPHSGIRSYNNVSIQNGRANAADHRDRQPRKVTINGVSGDEAI